MTHTLPEPTERLMLREIERTDFESIHSYATDPEVVRFMAWGPNTEADTTAFLDRAHAHREAEPRDHYGLAVERRADGLLLGSCGLRISDRANRCGFLGYCFRREAWGQGFATEAARAVLAFGFGTLGLHRIFAMCDVDNIASARVLDKAGMTREGTCRDHMLVRGQWRDHFVYAILEHEWNPGGS